MDQILGRKQIVELRIEDQDIHYFMEQSGITEPLKNVWGMDAEEEYDLGNRRNILHTLKEEEDILQETMIGFTNFVCENCL